LRPLDAAAFVFTLDGVPFGPPVEEFGATTFGHDLSPYVSGLACTARFTRMALWRPRQCDDLYVMLTLVDHESADVPPPVESVANSGNLSGAAIAPPVGSIPLT
jgi:hypothetical protein